MVAPETPREELEEGNNGIEEETAEHQEDEKVVNPEETTADRQYSGFERRKYFRYNLIYLPRDKVKLIIGDIEYEVLDISRGGLRFVYDSKIDLGMQIQGVIKFSDDESRAIEGVIVWGKDSEVGMKFNNLLPLFQLSAFIH